MKFSVDLTSNGIILNVADASRVRLAPLSTAHQTAPKDCYVYAHRDASLHRYGHQKARLER